MPTLTIDGRRVEVDAGATVLDAARKLGLQIPTLCSVEGCKAETSCMVCVVRVNGAEELEPSCATRVAEGMVVESETEQVKNARRTALDLLLGEHVGDCEAPCRLACPAHVNIPLMIRQIAAGETDKAMATVQCAAASCETCSSRCEKACRRASYDSAVSICLLKRFVDGQGVPQASNHPSVAGWKKRFNCHIGKLKDGEMEEFIRDADRAPRREPAGKGRGFSAEEAVLEARRCLHCDCRKSNTCRLRDWADACGASQQRYAGPQRPLFRRIVQHADVVYEPGKCIKCGLCVQVTGDAGERLGLTFLGRGFDARIGVPFNESLAAALEKTARRCVEVCPTGALANRNGEME